MNATWPRLAAIPFTSGELRAGVVLSLLAHLALVLLLTLSLNWRSSPLESVEAELWAEVPRVAAPRKAHRADVPSQKAQLAAKREREQIREAQIAIEKARSKARKKKRAEEDARIAAQRKANLKRLLGQVNATSTTLGRFPKSSGPSANYAARIKARIKPNIVYTESVTGDLINKVEVRCAANGSIISRQLLKSSGIPAWDDAVLRAIDKTEMLPRDVDGKVPSLLLIEFNARDF